MAVHTTQMLSAFWLRPGAFFNKKVTAASQWMKAGMENGELHQEDPVFCAWAILGMANTFVGGTRVEASDTAGTARRLVNLFLTGAVRQASRQANRSGYS